MKIIITFLFGLFCTVHTLCQPSNYEPIQREGISDFTYKKWTGRIKKIRQE